MHRRLEDLIIFGTILFYKLWSLFSAVLYLLKYLVATFNTRFSLFQTHLLFPFLISFFLFLYVLRICFSEAQPFHS